jgi:hypothetical protein
MEMHFHQECAVSIGRLPIELADPKASQKQGKGAASGVMLAQQRDSRIVASSLVGISG